jgi:hypothetical protein
MTKINNILRSACSRQRILAGAGLVFLILVSMSHPLSAQSVLQGYTSDQSLQRGMLVRAKEGQETKVEALTEKDADKLKGVITQKNDSPFTISSEDNNIFVAASGKFETLVSNENGPIKAGDFLSISSTPGIASKTGDAQLYIIGRAEADFMGTNDSIGSVDTKDGKKVQFARILVDVGLGKNPLVKIPQKDRVPDALQKISRSIADKPVSSVRIYVGLAVFVVSSIIAGTMLYSGTRSSLISVGRNPLSKATIYRGLLQVVILSLIVFITGLFGVYLLLKL